MKNLFKNLMLVAVAAMAFAACSQDVNEVNKVEKKTVISGVLNIENDDTRSGFVGKNEAGTAYVSEWDGGESIKIYIDGYGSVFTNVDAEGRFEVAVNGEISSGTSMYVCSPADAWDSQWTPTIPTEQTPRANSVDPAAHILQSVGATVGSSMITMSPQQACYGKMTVNAPEGFVIDNVVVNFKGTYYMNYERECTYTINADNVQNNVFWFATENFENVTKFTVTAYDAEGHAVAKTVDVAAAGKTLKFQWGHVSTFSVSDLKAVEPEPEQPDLTDIPAFNKARSAYSYGQDRQLYFYSDELSELVVNFYYCFDDNANKLKEGTYTTPGSGGIYVAGYSTYAGNNIKYMKATVSYVRAGYQIIFEDIQNQSGEVMLQKAIYIGEIENLAEIATMPKMELDKETVIFKAIGGTDTIEVTLKNYTADIEITAQGDAIGEWFDATLLDNTITIEAPANELEEQRTGTITITAGDITKTVDLMILGANAQKGVKENPYELEMTGYKKGMNIDFSCKDNGATLHLELNGSISGTVMNMEHSLDYGGPWWQEDHKYVVNGVTYTHDDFAPNSTSITEKLLDGTYKTLFKIVAGGTTTYYVVITQAGY